jgi:hypothetical protein
VINTPAEGRSQRSQPSSATFAVPRPQRQQNSAIPKQARNMSTSVTWLSNDGDEHDLVLAHSVRPHNLSRLTFD